MDMRCEMLLYMASRAQLVAQRIRPALQRGELVLADRFISSTLAYQGAAGGIAIDDILAVGRAAVGDCWPDLVVVFDVDQRTAAARLNPLLRQREFDSDLDRIEMRGAAYHRTVRQGYLDQAARDPDRYLVIDARADEEVVHERLLGQLRERCGAWK
jgi:dTMP kinase